MYLIIINMKMFKNHLCKNLNMFFIVKKLKYIIFFPKIRIRH